MKPSDVRKLKDGYYVVWPSRHFDFDNCKPFPDLDSATYFMETHWWAYTKCEDVRLWEVRGGTLVSIYKWEPSA